MTNKTVVALSTLTSAFLNAADNRHIEIHEIPGLGKIGLKKMSIAARDEWVAEKDSSSACLLQNTVCDPETGNLVLKEVERSRLNDLPTDIVDALIEKIFQHNGIKTQKQLQEQAQPEELKNSEADQS